MALSCLFTESEITDLYQSLSYSFHNHHHSFLILIIPVWPFYSHYCSLFSLDLFLPFSSSENISNDSLSKRLDPEPSLLNDKTSSCHKPGTETKVQSSWTNNSEHNKCIVYSYRNFTARDRHSQRRTRTIRPEAQKGPIPRRTDWTTDYCLQNMENSHSPRFLLSLTLHQQEPRTGCCQQVIQCFVHSIDNLP